MLGGTVGLMPWCALAGAVTWVVLFYSTRYVSVASVGLALALPAAAWFVHGFEIRFWFALALAAFVVFRHRENLTRLMKGTENRFPRKGSLRAGGPTR
jgi:glycerol-3-phosphate acyltransferase PlsY